MNNHENELLKEIITDLKKLGYEILSIGTSWIYYSDGTNIAYAQSDRLRGFQFSTVNKPNKSNGCGYVCDDKLSFEDAAKWALIVIKPSWEYSRHDVVKYTVEEFKSKLKTN